MDTNLCWIYTECSPHTWGRFWFLTYCVDLPGFFGFLPLAPLFIFCFLMKHVALVYHICYFCVHFYQHRFHFEMDRTVPFHSMVLAMLELFLFLFSLFFFLNSHSLFCNTIYCISLPVWISVYNSSPSCTFIVWLHASVSEAVDCHQVIVIVSASLCRWQSIRRSDWLNGSCFWRNPAVNWYH